METEKKNNFVFKDELIKAISGAIENGTSIEDIIGGLETAKMITYSLCKVDLDSTYEKDELIGYR
jgi:hypothetical protein